MKKLFLIIIVCYMAVTAAAQEGALIKEKAVLTKATLVMKTFADKMNATQDPQVMGKIAMAYKNEMEPLLPKVRLVLRNHPQWRKNPPKMMKPVLDKFMTAEVRASKAVKRLGMWADNHPKVKILRQAYNEIQSLFEKKDEETDQ